MTQDEIIEVAKQAGFQTGFINYMSGLGGYPFVKVIGTGEVLPNLESFAKLVAAKAIKDLESQEPVAWVAEDICKGQHIDGRPRKIWWECEKGVGMAFYTHPPQRTWVGLTDEEIKTICVENGWDSSWQSMRFSHAVEAKLKEKNNE
jgi:hypothetical protein